MYLQMINPYGDFIVGRNPNVPRAVLVGPILVRIVGTLDDPVVGLDEVSTLHCNRGHSEVRRPNIIATSKKPK